MSARPATYLLVFALAAACGLSAQDVSERPSRLTSPEDPVDAVRSAFNAAAGVPRFVTVLSPT